MALYHLSVKPVSRGGGRSAVACAAYRTATELHDERTGQTHDYERKRGVETAFIVTPEGAAWVQERERLWNAAEAAEKRKDARVGREYELALPCELDREGRRELVEAFAGELVERFGVAVDAAIHAPGREGDARNWHAHVLTTTRRAEAEGLGEKAAIELSDTARAKQGWGKAADEIEGLRAVWGGLVNAALERARVAERVDHRSFARQGVAREAAQHAGPAVSGMERKAERRRVAAERGQAGAREGMAPAEASGPVQGRQAVLTAAQHGLRTAWEGATGRDAVRPVSVTGPGLEGAARASKGLAGAGAAGMFGSGAAPVTRVGQRNAAIQARNRAAEAARKALEAAQRVLGELERAAREGVRRVLGLARGLGAQAAKSRQAREREAERERQAAELLRRAQERVEAKRRAELERQEQARLAERERERVAAELRRERDTVREAARRPDPAPTRSADDYWRRRAEREKREQSSEREGPSLEM